MSYVSVCVPVFNGMSYLPRALDSIASQTHGGIRILISVEPSDDDSLRFCLDAQQRDRRIEVFAQERRLFFVDNLNFLVRQVDTEFFCITPQDDLLEPNYLAALRESMVADGDAALAYADMDTGAGTRREFQASLCGNALERSIGYLARQMNHVEWRGMIRTVFLQSSPPFGRDEVIDHSLPLRLALHGNLLRVPQVLYHKTLHPGSGTANQRNTGTGRMARIRHVLESCLNCHRIVLDHTDDPALHILIRVALMLRVQHLMEMSWPLHQPERCSEPELNYFGHLLEHRIDDLFLVSDVLDTLSRNGGSYPRIRKGLEAELYLHLALVAEYTGREDDAAFLMGLAARLEPDLPDLDEFHASVADRLLNSGDNI